MLLVLLASTGTTACAATGDQLPKDALRPMQFEEPFDRSVASLESRYRLGISPWPNAINTRIHPGSKEQQIWTGGNFGKFDIQPLDTRRGILYMTDRPLPETALPAIARMADRSQQMGRITPAMRNNIGRARWSAGALASKESYGDGYYEVRMKMSPVKGRWQSFYLFDWDRGTEIDIVEAVGDRGSRCYNFTAHSKQKDLRKQTKLVCTDQIAGLRNPGAKLSEDFRLYGVRLHEGRIKAYFDRIEVADFPMPDYYKGARWSWILNIAVGGWPNMIGQPPEPGSSATAEVDHIRISGD